MEQNSTTSPKKTPVKVTPNVSKLNTPSSASKVVVFTPDQLQKLGFAAQLQDVLNKQQGNSSVSKIPTKRSPYKKRHPKLVKDKSAKPKVINVEEVTKSTKKSLKTKFSKLVKNVLLPDSINSKSSVGENMQNGKTEVRGDDVEQCNQLNVKKGPIIHEVIKLKTSPWRRRQILKKNEPESSDAQVDIGEDKKTCDTVVEIQQLDKKEEAVRDLFNVKISQSVEQTVEEALQLNEEDVIQKDANPESNENEGRCSLNSDKVIPAVAVDDYVIEDTMEGMSGNEIVTIPEDHQLQSNLNKEDNHLEQIHNNEKNSDVAQEGKQLNLNEEINEKEKRAVAEVAQFKQRDDTNEKCVDEENKIDHITPNRQSILGENKEEPVPEVIHLKPRRQRVKVRVNVANVNKVKEVQKLNEKNQVFPITSNSQHSDEPNEDYANQFMKFQEEEKEVGDKNQKQVCVLVENKEVAPLPEIEEIHHLNEEFPNVVQLKSPSKRRLSLRIDYDKSNENDVKKLNVEEKDESLLVENKEETFTSEEFVIPDVGQLKSPSKRRLSLRIDYEKSNENEVKRLNDKVQKECLVVENKEETPAPEVMQSKPLSEEKIEEAQQLNEELAIPDVGQSKSPSKRRLSLRIDYAKNNENKEVKKLNETVQKESLAAENNEKAASPKVMQSKPLLTRRQSMKKDETKEDKIEEAQQLNEELAIPDPGQSKLPSKRRASIRIDYEKSNENIQEVKKFNEEKRMESLVVDNKEEASVLEVVQSKSVLTRRQSGKMGKKTSGNTEEEKIEEAKHLNEEFSKSPPKRRLSVRIDYAKSNEDVKKMNEENKKVASVVPEIEQSKPILTRRSARKSEESCDKSKGDVGQSSEKRKVSPIDQNSRRRSIRNENEGFAIPNVGPLKSPSRKSYDKEGKDEEVKSLNEDENKADQKEVVQLKPRRQSMRMSEKKSDLTKKSTVEEVNEKRRVSPVNENRSSSSLSEKEEIVIRPLKRRHSHTDDEENELNENEKDVAPEIIRLKPQLKRRRNARIHETRNDQQEKANHNIKQSTSEAMEGVVEESEQEKGQDQASQLKLQQRRQSRRIVASINTATEEETVKLKTHPSRRKKSVAKDAAQQSNQIDGKSVNTDDSKSSKIEENETEQPQPEEEMVVTEGCSVEEKQKVIQLEDSEKMEKYEKQGVQIVANEVVFFSPSDIENLTKNLKSKPMVQAADPASVILKKSTNLRKIIVNKKLNQEENELIVKEEKTPPKCYTRKSKSKANIDENVSIQDNKKSEEINTILSADLTNKDADITKVEEEKEKDELVEPENSLSKNEDELRSSKVTESTSKSPQQSEILNKVELSKQSDKKIEKGDYLSCETIKLADTTEILQEGSGKKGPRKAILISKIGVIETTPEATLSAGESNSTTVGSEENLPVETEEVKKDDSLSSPVIKLADNTEILQKASRKSGRTRKSILISKTAVIESEPEEKILTGRSNPNTVESEANSLLEIGEVEEDSLHSKTTKHVDTIQILEKAPRRTGRSRKSTLISKPEVIETASEAASLAESEANLTVGTGEVQEEDSLSSHTTKLVDNTEILEITPRRTGRSRKLTLKMSEVIKTATGVTISSDRSNPTIVDSEAVKEDFLNSKTQKLVDNSEILEKTPRRTGRSRKSTVTSKTEAVETTSEAASTLESEENLPGKNEALEGNSKITKLVDNTEILQKNPKKNGKQRKSSLASRTKVVETANVSTDGSNLAPVECEENLHESKGVGDDSLTSEITKFTNSTEISQKTPRKVGRPKKSTVISTPEVVKAAPEAPILLGRSNRKRKVVDYSKLAKADESEVESDDDVVQQKPKRRKKDDSEVFEIDVKITPNPKTDEVDCSYSEVQKPRKKTGTAAVNALLFSSFIDAKLSEASQTLNEETASSEKLNADVKVKRDVKKKSKSNIATCAVCKLEMDSKAWPTHKLKKHNNLAWKVGEKPLNLNDSKFVLDVLNDMYKSKKNHFFCDKCENISRSVQGFLSHRSRCQKSTQDLLALNVACEHCNRLMLPVSLYAHLKFCQGLRPQDESLDGMEARPQEDSPLPRKRKAAEQASKFITALTEEDDQPKDRNVKYPKKWVQSFNFEVVPWAKNIIVKQCRENGSANCCFQGCEYQNSDWSEIFSHCKECPKKVEGFSCKLCLSTFEKKLDVIQHVKDNHHDEFKADSNAESSEDSYDDEDDDNENCKRRKDKRSSTNCPTPGNKSTFQCKFSSELNAISLARPIVYPYAWQWTFDFCREHFLEPNLFSNWRNSCQQNLDLTKLGAYLPKHKYSVCTSIIKCQKYVDPLTSDYDWKRFMLFESSRSDSGISSIFCGGAISAMAWVPTPYQVKNCEQILAVAIQPSLEAEYKVNQFYSDPGIIQFWNCGSFETAPKLQFCIAHDYNPIWTMEWCPSGCYDEEAKENENRRLGILAVGSGNSNVYLYTVCEPKAMSAKIIKLKPIKKLSLVINTEQVTETLKPQVSRISWTKGSGHQHIAVGYSSGVVALYNLHNLSDFLKYQDDDELETQLPYLTINAHVHSVTALTLSHISDGCRWLMTASADRTIKYWDLRQPTTPITSTSKFVVTDGVWLTHWLCSILCFDDSCNTGVTQTSLHQVRNFKSESCNVMHSNSAIQCISSCDWINGLIQGNAAGEIQGFFPHQLLVGVDNFSKYFKKKKAILSYCRLVEKNVSIKERLENEREKLKLMVAKPADVVDISEISSNPNRFKPEPVTYKGAEKKYGVVFCDYQLNKLDEFVTNINNYTDSHSEKYYPTRPNLYPMQSVTKVQINPNRSSYNYFAAGYQIGFVRIFPMKFLPTK